MLGEAVCVDILKKMNSFKKCKDLFLGYNLLEYSKNREEFQFINSKYKSTFSRSTFLLFHCVIVFIFRDVYSIS